MPQKIDDLREHLFATLSALRDPKNPMEIERAKAIAFVGKVIVESAKVEVQHLELTGGRGSGFLPDSQPASNLPRLASVPASGHAISKGK